MEQHMQHELSTSTTGGLWTYLRVTTVRQARCGDAAAIADIYNQAILARTSTFETTPRTARQIEAVLAGQGDGYPTMVVERGDRVVGWATSGPHSAHACFAGVAECSVYVDSAARGSGVGRAALEALIRECERHGFWKLLSCTFPENLAGRALARGLGFREVGVLARHAPVDGHWRDALIMERLLGAGTVRAEMVHAA
jgi:phosphinothricin acetyltransferase